MNFLDPESEGKAPLVLVIDDIAKEIHRGVNTAFLGLDICGSSYGNVLFHMITPPISNHYTTKMESEVGYDFG